jgi:hypothetical protein
MQTILPASIERVTRESFVGVISCVLGVVATFFNVHLALVLYAVPSLFFVTPPQPAREQF